VVLWLRGAAKRPRRERHVHDNSFGLVTQTTRDGVLGRQRNKDKRTRDENECARGDETTKLQRATINHRSAGVAPSCAVGNKHESQQDYCNDQTTIPVGLSGV
jgi:hypothetical protein